jgi:hypothetical protein
MSAIVSDNIELSTLHLIHGAFDPSRAGAWTSCGRLA